MGDIREPHLVLWVSFTQLYSASWYKHNSDEQPPWCLTGPCLPSPLSRVRSLTAPFVFKGKSTACSARLDYMKSKIWLIIACKLTGKSRWWCTECGSKESSRSHCPGLRRAKVSMFTLSRDWTECHGKVWSQDKMLASLQSRWEERRWPAALLLELWGRSECPEVTWRMSCPCFRTWNACLFHLATLPWILWLWLKLLI